MFRDACRLITSYSHDTMAALILGKELDSFCNPKDDFLDLMKSATKTINEEFCGVSVPRAFHCISMGWGHAVWACLFVSLFVGVAAWYIC